MTSPTSRPRVLCISASVGYLAGHRLSTIAKHCHLETASSRLPMVKPLPPGETLPDVPHHKFFMRSQGPHPMDVRTLMDLTALIGRIKPDLVHLIGAKPIIYGGLASRVLRRGPAVIAAFPGLGPAFIEKEDGRPERPVLSWLGGAGFRMALHRRRVRVIFQNTENAALFEDRGYIRRGSARTVPGSGIDLKKYRPAPHAPEGAPLTVFIARLLRSKGILEFAEAARQLRMSGVSARFAIIGVADPNNPDSLTDREVGALESGGHVEIWGWRKDMVEVLHQAHIVCLPSYYPEGIPRVLLEAAACGLPAVTTDTPGCREAVADGKTGLLVPPRDTDALANALAALLDDQKRAVAMGRAARARAETSFGSDRIVAETLSVYQELLGRDFFPGAKVS